MGWVVFSDVLSTRLYLGRSGQWLADRNGARIFDEEHQATRVAHENEIATGYEDVNRSDG